MAIKIKMWGWVKQAAAGWTLVWSSEIFPAAYCSLNFYSSRKTQGAHANKVKWKMSLYATFFCSRIIVPTAFFAFFLYNTRIRRNNSILFHSKFCPLWTTFLETWDNKADVQESKTDLWDLMKSACNCEFA